MELVFKIKHCMKYVPLGFNFNLKIILRVYIFMIVQPPRPNIGMILLPIYSSFHWSDISSDDTITLLSVHIVS